ncbi:MAG: hypothetical protein FWH40_06845 [Coriobacteriia bacterium]|nr:hypothetical protein [Coriobacteriia bacterium]
MNSNSILKLTVSGLLIAIGIVIPMLSPFKIVLEPASFTLASHVTIFIAMFISPGMAAAVAVGTTIGFFLGGFPIVIVFRAASHLVFATIGALWLRKISEESRTGVKIRLFSLAIGLIHAFCELLVVTVFYFGGNVSAMYYQKGFVLSVLLLVGLGTVVHSMIDFEIAKLVMIPLKSGLASLSSTSKA